MRKSVSDAIREAGHRWIDAMSLNKLADLLPASALQDAGGGAETPEPAAPEKRPKRRKHGKRPKRGKAKKVKAG